MAVEKKDPPPPYGVEFITYRDDSEAESREGNSSRNYGHENSTSQAGEGTNRSLNHGNRNNVRQISSIATVITAIIVFFVAYIFGSLITLLLNLLKERTTAHLYGRM
ncbi:hypothetical protein F5Y00DRAFT_264692 [Daldinia vernicosa]|uniref:uncharacterized protein n=1 Tax=Daldinia vernicosa TaxID=114800 RepID=UPI002007CD8E|nr:uncharacterized protein F5Y00DRAFT_264692 [Daldinia vernicosa]KAI0846311.1 hypothetical protein F5Y00DRAFT_264692 [Daldinia vernicosa]